MVIAVQIFLERNNYNGNVCATPTQTTGPAEAHTCKGLFSATESWTRVEVIPTRIITLLHCYKFILLVGGVVYHTTSTLIDDTDIYCLRNIFRPGISHTLVCHSNVQTKVVFPPSPFTTANKQRHLYSQLVISTDVHQFPECQS